MRKLALSRREFIAGLGAGGGTLLLYALMGGTGSTEALLRPPGAQDENAFLARCLRCQACVRACLTACLEPAPVEFGASKLWTPRFVPRLAKCEFELCDRACAKACPVNALQDIPVDRIKLGIAQIDKPKCLAWEQGLLCLVCQECCTYLAITQDRKSRPHVDANKCVGCGACENICIADSAAIRVLPLSSASSPPGSTS